jgi:hypothetical protein
MASDELVERVLLSLLPQDHPARSVLRTLYAAPPQIDETGVIPLVPDVPSEGMMRPGGFWFPRRLPRVSLEMAARLFDALSGQVIVEIGSGLHGDDAGNSAMVWTTTRARAIHCVDLDPARLEQVHAWATQAGHQQVHVKQGDGIAFLESWSGSLDLLYLDYWTEDPPGTFFGTGREQSYLTAFRVAEPKLAPRALLLIDDTDHVPPWKHTALIPAARSVGFQVLWTGRQTMLARGLR